MNRIQAFCYVTSCRRVNSCRRFFETSVTIISIDLSKTYFLKKCLYFDLCTKTLCREKLKCKFFIHRCTYGVTAPSRPCSPPEDAPILFYPQLFFSNLICLGSVMHHSRRRSSILFLVFPLIICCEIFRICCPI